MEPTRTKRDILHPIGLKARNVIALPSIIDPKGLGASGNVPSRSVGSAQMSTSAQLHEAGKTIKNKEEPSRTNPNLQKIYTTI